MENSEPVCGKEALELLNCASSSSYYQEKCVYQFNSLRKCALNKKVKKFSMAGETQGKSDPINKHG